MTTVIKLGGSLLDDAARRDGALRKIVARWNAGEDIVLVHGGGKHIDAALAQAGIAKKTHAGLRITDDATLKIVVSVIDNLLKGAASQAVQNFNRMFGFPETEGLQ